MELILVVDDDPEIRRLLSFIMESAGLRTCVAASGAEALAHIEEQVPDLIILDIMMDQLNGFELLTVLRDKKLMLPIILLSAKTEDMDKVHGFGLGADDYVTKPFSPIELVARVQAHLRRHNVNPQYLPDTLKCGIFRLETETQILYKHDQKIVLTMTESILFSEFMKYPNKVHTKSQLSQAAWCHTQFDDNTLNVYISRLRQKIEDYPKNPVYLQTVWGIGYRLNIGDVS